MFYDYSWNVITVNQFIAEFDEYVECYGKKRIKLSLGGMSPLDYLKNMDLIA